MAIKPITSVTGFEDVADYGGQGSMKNTHPLTSMEVRSLPEFMRALNYARAAVKAKQLLNSILKSIPANNRGTMLKELEHEMKRDNFLIPTVDVRLFSTVNKDRTSALASEYLSSRRLLCLELGTLDKYTRARAERIIRQDLGVYHGN